MRVEARVDAHVHESTTPHVCCVDMRVDVNVRWRLIIYVFLFLFFFAQTKHTHRFIKPVELHGLLL